MRTFGWFTAKELIFCQAHSTAFFFPLQGGAQLHTEELPYLTEVQMHPAAEGTSTYTPSM